MEHRDGSGPVFTYKSATTGTQRQQYYLMEDKLESVYCLSITKVLTIVYDFLSWKDKPTEIPFPLRSEQLKFRQAEIYDAFDALESLAIEGKPKKLYSSNGHSTTWEQWKGAFDPQNLIFAGHSFGSATGVSVRAHHLARYN